MIVQNTPLNFKIGYQPLPPPKLLKSSNLHPSSGFVHGVEVAPLTPSSLTSARDASTQHRPRPTITTRLICDKKTNGGS